MEESEIYSSQYNRYEPCTRLKIPFQDLFRFWWNRCVEQDLVFDEVLEDIFDYFTELMRPPEKQKEEVDLRLDFDQLIGRVVDYSVGLTMF